MSISLTNKFSRFFLILTAIIMVSGCRQDNSLNEFKEYVEKLALQKASDNELWQDVIMIEEASPENKVNKEKERLLSNFPIASLMYIGYLSNSIKTWGILKSTADSIVPIKLGDVITKENLEVIKITPEEVVLSDGESLIFYNE